MYYNSPSLFYNKTYNYELENNISSSEKSDLSFISKSNNNSDISYNQNEENKTSTPQSIINSNAVEDKQRILFEYYNKKKEYENKKETITKQLIIYLKDFSLENDSFSIAEKEIYNITKDYSFGFLGEILSNIYLDYYENVNVISGICHSLERFDANEIRPWAQSIIIGLINHKSDIVKERVISLIENLEDKSLLSALKNIEIKSEWMKEYIGNVISYLEKL